MGIFCEINLHKLGNEAFIAGSTVKGVIRYAVDDETTFKQITVSLKGKGTLSVKKKHNDRSKDITHWNSEDYLNIENVITEPGIDVVVPVGSYEIPINFKLPHNIPPSFHYSSNTVQYAICCNIRYLVGIKFERHGFLKFDKKYKKEITIESGIEPRLPFETVIYGKQKKLTQLLSHKKSTVNIKASIAKSVISSGEKVQLEYEVINESNKIVKAVETKVIELYTFKTKGTEVTQSRDIPNAESKAGSIKCNERQAMSVEISIPEGRNSLDFSQLVARNYFVQITAKLPFPHFNAVLKIPIQVGDGAYSEFIESPPSYWEAMSEDEKDEKE